MLSVVKIAFGVLVLSNASLALDVKTKMRGADVVVIVGHFGNGAKFEYAIEKSKVGTLSYESRDGATKFEVPDLHMIFYPTFNSGEPRNYVPRPTDRAVFFEDEKNLYVLTEKGSFAPVLPKPERFQGGNWTVRGNINDGTGRFYAVVSGEYLPEHRTLDAETGETYVIRLSDGKVVLESLSYRPVLDGVVAAGGELLFDKAGRGFSLKEFPVEDGADMGVEPIIRKAKARGPVVEGSPGPAKLVADSGPAAVPRTAPQSDGAADLSGWKFPNGSMISVRTGGEDAGIYFETPDGQGRTRITSDIPVERYRPGRGRSSSASIEGSPKSGLVSVDTENGVWVITQTGEAQLMPADYPQTRGRQRFEKRIRHGGKEFLIQSFKYDSYVEIEGKVKHTGKGETFVIREDGLFTRLDYRVHELVDDLELSRIQDGILEIAGSPRELDLDRFDAEARFSARPMGKVQAQEGQEIDPIAEVLGRFQDLTAEVRAGRKAFKALDEDAETKLRVALQREEGGSAALLGDSGTGKTELVNSLVEGIVTGKYPELPRTVRVLKFDPMSVGQGSKYVSAIESRVKALVEACKQIPIVLFLDEMHSMRGIGTHSGNENDIFQYLKPALASGDLRIIGTSTADEYNASFAGDAALSRRFTTVQKNEAKGEEILVSAESWIEKFRKSKPPRDVLEYAVRLASEFNAVGAQPAKSIDLLKQVYAFMPMQGRGKEAPTKGDLEKAAEQLYQADPALFDFEALKAKLAGLPEGLETHVIGQHQLKETVLGLAVQRFTGMHDAAKPGIRVLITGPQGTGKTETARSYAEIMGLPFVRVEMNRYANGNPKAFLDEVAQALRKNAFSVLAFDEFEKAHVDVQQALLGLLDSGSFNVDENLNTSARSGRRTVRISALNATVFATTNAGAEYVLAVAGSRPGKRIGFMTNEERARLDQLNQVVDTLQAQNRMPIDQETLNQAVIQGGIPAVVLDRFQAVVPTLPPTPFEFRQVVQLHLRRAIRELSQKHGVEIAISSEEEFLEAVVRGIYKPGMSNREAVRVIQDQVRSALAKSMLDSATGEKKPGQVSLSFKKKTEAGGGKKGGKGGCGGILVAS